MSTILPITVNINMDNLLHYAHCLSILSSYPHLHNWIMSHYTIPYGVEQYSDHPYGIYMNYLDAASYAYHALPTKVLSIQSIPDEFIQNIDLLDCIEQNINLGTYLVVLVDEYYLDQCRLGKNSHLLHPQLIYGIDKGTQSIFSTGMNRAGKYACIRHSFNAFCKAYRYGIACEKHGNLAWAQKNRIMELTPFLSDCPYPHNTALFLNNLGNYLKSHISPNDLYLLRISEAGKIRIGLDYYGLIHEQIQKEHPLSFRYLHHLREHKQLIKTRLHFFLGMQKTRAVKAYENTIVAKAGILRSLSIKYAASQKDGRGSSGVSLQHIIDLLYEIRENEISIFSEVVDG